MDFGSLSGRSTKSSMKRKQSNSLLTAFRKSSQPPTSYLPPASTTSSNFPDLDSPYPESASSQSHSQATYNGQSSSSASGSGSARYAESSASSSRTAVPLSADGSGQYPVFGRGGAGRIRSGSEAVSLRGGSISGSMSQGGGGSSAGGEGKREREKSGGGATARRPEDMIRIVKDRLFSWSYMMQWYSGDIHWFNTVKIPRSTTEAHLGPKALESRARNFFILGISLGLIFDIANVGDFCRAVNRVLDEWESMVEGGGKVRGIFKGQKGSRKSSSGGGYMGMQDNDSALMQVNLPFTLDFFQVHSSTCSIIRDIYRKMLKFFLPSRATYTPPIPDPNALTHPSTIINSAPLDSSASAPTYSRSNSGSVADHTQSTLRSPSTRSASSMSHTPGGFSSGFGSPRREDGDDLGMSMEQAFMTSPSPAGRAGAGTEGEHDAFQSFIIGELGQDRMLVGEGQPMTKEVMDLFTKVDAKLRKHFSGLLRETDLLARRVLDDELNGLMMSLNPGSNPLSFDYNAALSNTGNGFAMAQSKNGSRSRPGSSGTAGGSIYHGHMGSSEPVPPLPTSGSLNYVGGREP